MNTNEEGVMHTNDDATQCKFCAVNLGYWQDQFIQYFIHRRLPCQFNRKTPEINRGYYARIKAFDYLLNQFFIFIRQINEKNINLNNHKLLKCQIINIGCGFDTLYWRLKENKKIDCIQSFVDLDLEGVVYKKVNLIKAKNELLKVLGNEIKYNKFDIHSKEYHLVSADLKNINQLNEKLFKNCNLDLNLPTFVISECVLVYLSSNDVNSFLKLISSKFENLILANYQQVNLFDKFGEIMIDNFKLRNCEILDLNSCKDLDTQKQKYLNNGFQNVNCCTIETIYKNYLDKLDRERIEKIEFLDETDLLNQLLNHYCIVVAYKGLMTLLNKEYKFGFL